MAGANHQIQPLGEREVARILQRAAALQEQDRQRGPRFAEGTRGVSLGELKQIAGEVGIDPRYVDAAAAELLRNDQGRGQFLFWGAPVSSEVAQTVEGAVPVEAWEELVAKIRRCTGDIGRSTTLGQALEWTGQKDHMSVSPRDGRTTIRILSGHTDATAAAHATALSSTLFALMPIVCWLHSVPLEAAGLIAATAGGLFGLARVWAGARFRCHRDRMQALLQEIADHVAQTAEQASREPSRFQSSSAAEAPVEDKLPLCVPEHTRP